MTAAITMPGHGILMQWLKRAGDWVVPGEPVAHLAVGQMHSVARAPAGGVLSALLVLPGRPLAAGSELAYVDTALPGPGGQKLLPWDDLRQRIAAHMQYSNNTAAHVTTGVEVDMSRLEMTRGLAKERGTALGLTPFFIRAAAEALVDWPYLNGQVTAAGLLIPDRIHVAAAVSVPGGVHLVVLRDAPSKPVSQLAAELNLLAALVRSGQGGPHISDGGTFTVTSPGSLGSVWGTAVISQPNCAILACHAIVKRPVVIAGDRIEVRPMMNMSLTFDHRVLDGVLTLGFLGRARELLEAARFPI